MVRFAVGPERNALGLLRGLSPMHTKPDELPEPLRQLLLMHASTEALIDALRLCALAGVKPASLIAALSECYPAVYAAAQAQREADVKPTHQAPEARQ